MKVLLVTNYGKPWDMGRSIDKTLKKMGHKTEVFDYTEMPDSFLSRGIFNLTSVRTRVQRTNIRRINKKLISLAGGIKPDMVFVVKGESISPETLETIKKETDTILVNWFPDDPHMFNISSKTAACYDRVFTSGAAGIVKEYAKIGAAAEPIGFAYDPNVFKPRKPYGPYKSDICFVGSCYPERAILMDRIRGKHLKIWGDGWTRERVITKLIARKLLDHNSFKRDFASTFRKLIKINPWPYCQGRGLFMEDASMAFSSSKIVLNFHVSRPFRNSGTNMRDFEVTGAGRFLLADRVDALSQNFKAGKEIAIFETPKEMFELIEYFLENETERERIMKAGLKRAREYTYEKRVRHILSSIRI